MSDWGRFNNWTVVKSGGVFEAVGGAIRVCIMLCDVIGVG